VRRVVQPRPGSAHRFSQPLSGFLAHLGFTALFRAATVPGIPPFRAFPSQESRTPLGATLLPCRCPPTCWDASPGSCCRRFRRLPRPSAQSPGSPDAWAPFRYARGRTSRSPWTPSGETVPFRQLHRLRSVDPPASPFAPAQVSLNRRPLLSWVSASLELSPPTPRIL
jgi:hypothetical protein